MENTYTYTARNAENSQKVVTFTLHGDRMSVDMGTPLEQVAQVTTGEPEAEEKLLERIWLRPIAVSLIERGTAPLRLVDVETAVDGDYLLVRSWVRVMGLRFLPITLMHGRVDNADAATAFVEEVATRREALDNNFPVLRILDYWWTWLAAVTSLVALFAFWRNRADSKYISG